MPARAKARLPVGRADHVDALDLGGFVGVVPAALEKVLDWEVSVGSRVLKPG